MFSSIVRKVIIGSITGLILISLISVTISVKGRNKEVDPKTNQFLQLLLLDLDTDIELLSNIHYLDSVRSDNIARLTYNINKGEAMTSENFRACFDLNFFDFQNAQFALSYIPYEQGLSLLSDNELRNKIVSYYHYCRQSKKLEQDFTEFKKVILMYQLNTDAEEILSLDLMKDNRFKKYIRHYNGLAGEKARNSGVLLRKAKQLRNQIRNFKK